SYAALWKLKDAGIKIVPVTGRPAGWCEMIARLWPVEGVVGENGAFYFRHHGRVMKRFFAVDEKARESHRKKLDSTVAPQILKAVNGCAIASDQFSRISDLAIDYCEDVSPLKSPEVSRIVEIFEKHGAQAKVSSIHVNGWFGDVDKLSMCKEFLKREFNLVFETSQERLAFVGDSPNDEPMFRAFQNSFAVANIQRFLAQLIHKPAYVTSAQGGDGFCELADVLCRK
ncbi:MAG: HAD-IIB family hydrolase, partial [Bdellovibrionia bacterium]